MTETRRAAINKMASIICDHFNISSPLSYKKLVDIVQEFGGKIRSEELEEFTYGMIRVNGEDNFEITYKEKESEEEKIFTIAHELGHYFLHLRDDNGRLKKEYIDSPLYRRGISAEEDEANEFASSLLMPKKAFLEYVTNNMNGQYINIPSLAKYFNVTPKIALNRGKSLGCFL